MITTFTVDALIVFASDVLATYPIPSGSGAWTLPYTKAGRRNWNRAGGILWTMAQQAEGIKNPSEYCFTPSTPFYRTTRTMVAALTDYYETCVAHYPAYEGSDAQKIIGGIRDGGVSVRYLRDGEPVTIENGIIPRRYFDAVQLL